MTKLDIEYLPTATLHAYPRNARTHSKKQIKQIAESIRQFGFTNPLLIDDHHMILAGHGRLAAARILDMSEVPCVRLSHMTAAQKKAYVLADNKLALNAGWDEELLAEELEALLGCDAGFDVSITGFTLAEVDQLIARPLSKTATRQIMQCQKMAMALPSAGQVTSGNLVHIV